MTQERNRELVDSVIETLQLEGPNLTWSEQLLIDYVIDVLLRSDWLPPAEVRNDHDAMLEHLRDEWGTAGLVRKSLEPVAREDRESVVNVALANLERR